MTDETKNTTDKPLDKMTVTELREVAKELPDLTGVHGMKKAELLEAVKAAKGVTEEPPPPKKSTAKPKKDKKVTTVRELKDLIRSLRAQRVKALADKDKKMAKICRRRISRLKKKTRQAA